MSSFSINPKTIQNPDDHSTVTSVCILCKECTVEKLLKLTECPILNEAEDNEMRVKCCHGKGTAKGDSGQ